MIENQDVEFKSIWKDEWLEWICMHGDVHCLRRQYAQTMDVPVCIFFITGDENYVNFNV